MKEIQYRYFSLSTHGKNLRLNRPSVCQFELTFRCGLHCWHCYTDCYNKAAYIKKELNIEKIKLILDNLHKAGIIWLCFTGGDPLIRNDFLDIYAYAKDRGFIITIFTSGYTLTGEMIEYFKKKPPFVIEITLNAVTEGLYEKISQVKGSFAKVMEAINLILKEKLPLKIKTQVTKDNIGQLPGIKKFVKKLGLRFTPSFILYPRLNKDAAPCNLRVSPFEVLGLDEDRDLKKVECGNDKNVGRTDLLYPCVAGGGDGFYMDPYGKAFCCNLIREPSFDVLKMDIKDALNRISPLMLKRRFLTDSRCRRCALKEECLWCPGRAYLEKGDMEKSIGYYCKLATLSVQNANQAIF